MANTIQDILQQIKTQGYNQLPGFHGKQLNFEFATREQVLKNKVDEIYQRMISVLKISSYGQCDLLLLIPSIISRRPKEFLDLSGDFIIDGQNKEVIYANSGHEGNGKESGCPQMVIEQEYDPSMTLRENYKRVLEQEAKLFQALNTRRKKLTRIDELRAEVVYGDELAVNIESVMRSLDVVSDRFGSSTKSAKEVKSFSQFYYALTADYDISNPLSTAKIASGYELWKKIYGNVPNSKKLHGTAFRAICFLHRFITEGLTNGVQESFEEWCVNRLAECFNQEKLVNGFGTFESPRWVLYRIIDKYNDEITNKLGTGAPTIKEKRLDQAIALSGEDRFEHPDEDEWARRLGKS